MSSRVDDGTGRPSTADPGCGTVTWKSQLRLPDGRRKCFYARTRDGAVDQLEDGAWMLASQLPVRRATPTLGEYLDRWLEITRRRVRPSYTVVASGSRA